jgi:hypothetical protein
MFGWVTTPNVGWWTIKMQWQTAWVFESFVQNILLFFFSG